MHHSKAPRNFLQKSRSFFRLLRHIEVGTSMHTFWHFLWKIGRFKTRNFSFSCKFLDPRCLKWPIFGVLARCYEYPQGQVQVQENYFSRHVSVYSLDLILVKIPIKGQNLAQNGQKRPKSGNFPKPMLFWHFVWKIGRFRCQISYFRASFLNPEPQVAHFLGFSKII